MKKMISCIAALAIIAAAPAATVFAAESEPSTGAEATVTSETAYDVTDIRNITGRWKYQVAEEGKNITAGVTDNGFIDVKEDGTFIYTDLDGKTIAGTVKVDYDTFGGEFKVPFFAFYGDSDFYIGCYCDQNDKDVYITGNGGESQLVRVTQDKNDTDKPETEEPSAAAETPAATGTAYDLTDIHNITGRWKYQVAEEGKNITAGVTDNGFIDVKEDGTFIYTDLDGKTVAGTVKVDYDTFGGEFKVPFFAFYGDSDFYIGCYCDQNDRDVYITGNGGESRLVRVIQENEKPAEEITDEKSAEKKEIAVSRMEDFNTIMAIMNASPLQTVNDAVVNDHVKVKDCRFTSIGAFKSFVSETLTGDLRDQTITVCDDCFTEHEGALYVKNAGRSFFSFETMYGVAVLDPAMGSFSALTMGGNDLFGKGLAEFRIEDGRWKINSYKNGTWRELMAVEEYDISAVAGIWYEDTEGSSNVLNIRTDGVFSYACDGGTDFGTVQAVYRLDENGAKVIGIELVKDNSADFFAGFKAPEETPCNDIYLDQEGSSTHYVRRKEPGTYTVEQLSDMAAKDYEKKTGVKPSNTQPMINDDNSVTVAVYDENAKPVDAYHLDPDTGKGTLNSDKSEVVLPQTGNNSLRTAGAAVSALLLAVAGAFALLKSGMLRRKENE